jgi:mRNA-degrading endonuclease RelE of RelBE toxin-antitoxin system
VRFEFIETPVFKKRIDDLLSDEERQRLQNLVLENPHVGAVIPKTGGARKLRFGRTARGKRGGLRVICAIIGHCILFLMVYEKSAQVDLTPENKRMLRDFLGGKR